MIDLAVYNKDGEKIDSLKVDEAALGSTVRYPLLKQAIVMYHANKRVGTAATKSRGMVVGSSRKLFRQKGTGNARVGTSRTGKRVGGGVTFAKVVRGFGKRMPKKQRRLAAETAVLAKLLSNNVTVVDELSFEKPHTGAFVSVLDNLKILSKGSCLVMVGSVDTNLYKSARNIPRVSVCPLADLNAGDICKHNRILFTKDAFLALLSKDKVGGRGRLITDN